ncbi:sarcosine oxidase subunit delta [Rhodoferax sp.]|jgi:heterotetrameric sarcosine oxidase delta subunit|uniref:sarcosine oxidase subunit delta n=1 Tax=Rhodoferax sp. TaxID=50421 RepID=UPI0037836285
MLRIHCPHCGIRDHEEFSYFGDATKAYPGLEAENHAGWVDAVYTRNNPKGVHQEFWQHTLACRRWLVVRRNTVTHEILEVLPARQRAIGATQGASCNRPGAVADATANAAANGASV